MIVGTAGHIDHGKTALVKALTGIDADRLPEEKARGITLDLGYAYAALPDGEVIGFIDVPGHERLIHNMLAGATGIDLALLLVAADDGPMPQTREHLELIELLGIDHLVAVLAKVDAVSPQRRSEARGELETLLCSGPYRGAPVFEVSAHRGDGVAALWSHLQQQRARMTQRARGGGFRLAIDRCFTLPGIGTVVTGTAFSGMIEAGAHLTLSPPGRSVRVRSLRVQDQPATQGGAGQRCALALAGDIEKREVARGMWLVAPPLALPLLRFHAELRVPHGREPVRHLQRVHLHLGATDVIARVALLTGNELAAGCTAPVELLAERELLALRGDRFVLRDASAQRTVAGGRVLDIFPPARHKRSAAHLDYLQALTREDPRRALETLGRQAGRAVDLARFGLNWNLGAGETARLARDCGWHVVDEQATPIGLPAAQWTALTERVIEAVSGEHQRAPELRGIARERLRRMVAPTLPVVVFDELLAELLRAGSLAQAQAWLHLPSHAVRLAPADRALFDSLRPLLDASPFNPPRVRDVHKTTGIAEDGVRQLFRRVARTGELYPVAHDHFFTAATVAELAAIVARLCVARGAARAADLRDAIFANGGGGRKVAIHILEFFDRVGYTRRVGDAHVVRSGGADQQWLSS